MRGSAWRHDQLAERTYGEVSQPGGHAAAERTYGEVPRLAGALAAERTNWESPVPEGTLATEGTNWEIYPSRRARSPPKPPG